jgi:hypothetical protein
MKNFPPPRCALTTSKNIFNFQQTSIRNCDNLQFVLFRNRKAADDNWSYRFDISNRGQQGEWRTFVFVYQKKIMDSDENRRKNLWQHQQHGTGDNNQQFYANQYQVRG